MPTTVFPLVWPLICCLLVASCSSADGDELPEEILNLKHQVERLEKSRISLEDKLAEKAQEPSGFHWWEIFTLTGLLEIEAGYLNSTGRHETNLTVSAIEMGIDARITPWMNGHVLVLYQEDQIDPPEIDEAILTLANEDESPWSLALGRMYVPFGHFDSNMVSDPLTLAIGETRATAVLGGYLHGDWVAQAYLFKGNARYEKADRTANVGIRLGLNHEPGNTEPAYGIGLSWIANLADSNNFREAIGNPGKQVPGLGLHAGLQTGPWQFTSEYLGTLVAFDSNNLTPDATSARPEAFNLEIGYHFRFLERDCVFGLAWQQSQDSRALNLPRKRFLTTLAMEICKYTTLSLEYARDRAYAIRHGKNQAVSHALTLQLAASF